jgi:pyruvate-ferredoxin/flavodoxin oxidoreductase
MPGAHASGEPTDVEPARSVIDGNEAAAWVAYRASEVIAIYPITPATPMGEHADGWSAKGVSNAWGAVPRVIELQSEGGAAGAIHGALQAGALATTFTSSQGLLLMLPNMFKIAGELTPAVIHVAARTVATHGLSIFGDHSDVMAARTTGWAELCSSSVQEAQDFALVAHAATLRTRVPFLHFFDGFRTSHELATIERLTEDDVRALLDESLVREHRARALHPETPVLRGTAQNPDVFFQMREASNPFHASVPSAVQHELDRLAERTGRVYRLFDYHGDPEAERVLVLMGSGAQAAGEAVDALRERGEKVGVVTVRLFRPFAADAFVAALPASVRGIAVLDRTKEPGAQGEPLFQDVVTALAERGGELPRVLGGRYGLASKEFTPAMARAALDELTRESPKRRFTVGIEDDVTRLSLSVDDAFTTEADDVVRAVFYGLGADGTVSANRSSIAIIGEHTGQHAQAYFVYDSKKSGSVTVSHLRFGPRPIRSPYLVDRAGFVACHQFGLLEKLDVLEHAAPGATVLLNAPYPADEVWEHLPPHVQETVVERGLRVHAVDATAVAREAGLGRRVNTVLQTCFFALAGILPLEEAIDAIKTATRRAYGKRGEAVIARNLAAIDQALAGLHEVPVPRLAGARAHAAAETAGPSWLALNGEPAFVRDVTAAMLQGRGDALPVSALPADGTFPTGTSRIEKRSIAEEIPIWDPSICIDCAKCALVCPHAAIRMKIFPAEALDGAPEGFLSKDWRDRHLPGMRMTIQVAPDDCTGCGICVETCPAHAKEEVKHRSINLEPKLTHLAVERDRYRFFLNIPELDRTLVEPATIKGSQALQPLFEYSGACEGCGETPYLKLLTQLFGDRIVVANATGCSSIYGGNLPTTPWTVNAAGHGPAWANSLFEDNAEFGLGMRLALDAQRTHAEALVAELAPDLAPALLEADQATEDGVAQQRQRVDELRARLRELDTPEARRLEAVARTLVRTSVWIVGGDGWAYDIGFGGLDHVLASGADVNVLVLDTEVYSNTGGQASKATPRGAVAKFASGGKKTRKKDLGQLAAAYGDVYVAQIALGADNAQTVKALAEADAWNGPSLVIAYSHCIAHGIEMAQGLTQQKRAVDSGYWPLWRYDPRHAGAHEHPFSLDSRAPTIPLDEFTSRETRFALLARSDPDEARRLGDLAQHDVTERRLVYEQLAEIEHEQDDDETADTGADTGEEAAGDA